MKVIVDNNAKDYISQKTDDNSITIVVINTGSGWCPSFQPSVRMGKPKDEKGFNLVKDENIDIYIKSGLKSKREKVEISLGKFLWKKYLNVDGISI